MKAIRISRLADVYTGSQIRHRNPHTMPSTKPAEDPTDLVNEGMLGAVLAVVKYATGPDLADEYVEKEKAGELKTQSPETKKRLKAEKAELDAKKAEIEERKERRLEEERYDSEDESGMGEADYAADYHAVGHSSRHKDKKSSHTAQLEEDAKKAGAKMNMFG